MAGNLLPLVLIGGIAVVLSKKKKKRKSSGIKGNIVHVKSEGQIPAIATALKPGQTLIILILDLQSPSYPAIKAEIGRVAAANPDTLFGYADYRWSKKHTGPGGMTAIKKTGSGGAMSVGTANFDGTAQSFIRELAGLVTGAPSIAPGGGYSRPTPSGPTGAGTPTRPDPTPAPSTGTGSGPTDECDPLDPSTWGEGNICAMVDGRWVRLEAASPQADNAGRAEMESLGYSEFLEPSGSLALAIGMFQSDWNWFVGYIAHINPDINYEDPYSMANEDGAWSPATIARVSKAMVKFDGETPVYVEELGADAATFHDMILGLQALSGANT